MTMVQATASEEVASPGAPRVTRVTTVIRVVCGDPLIRDGVAAQLAGRIGVRVVDPEVEAPGAVAVVVADEVDTATLLRIRAARAAGHAKVVLVAARLDEDDVVAAVESGAGSILWRHEATVDAIVSAVRGAHDGHGCLPPDLLGRLLNRVETMPRPGSWSTHPSRAVLSEREVSVLRLVADGHDTVEVGRRLAYSERAVKAIIHDVTNRFDLRNRTHAATWALRHGLI